MSAKINEKYFGIRVGNPRKHHCYLWCDQDRTVPRLFTDRAQAKIIAESFDTETPAKVVRVRVTSPAGK